MTPAEKRIKDLVNRWLVSLDLHLQYADLNDLAYNRVQNWPVHDRPNKAILEIAKQKSEELNAILIARQMAGDTKFAEAVELVNFLTNLVGSQYVQRFIPLAEAPKSTVAEAPKPTAAEAPKTSITPTAPKPNLASKSVSPPSSPSPSYAGGNSTTVQMLPVNRRTATAQAVNLPAQPQRTAAAAASGSNAKSIAPASQNNSRIPELDDSLILAARIESTRIQAATTNKRELAIPDVEATREMPQPQRSPAAHKKQPVNKPAISAPTPSKANQANASNGRSNIEQLIIADAVRLTNWGREWHELAEAIARIADRPSVAEIRKILRNHRDEIKRRAAEPQS